MSAMPRRRYRRIVLAVGAIVIILAGPLVHLARVAWRDTDGREVLRPNSVDDASRLNRTMVAEVWDIPVDVEESEDQLRELLARARAEGRRVSIAGARHSMGGHTIYPGGIAINMLPWNKMSLDETTNILHVQAGATWRDVIAYLDSLGRSVAVMQSNNSFTVGGSISVNCHGWQFDRPPIASTVDSFRIMRADGSIVLCSRNEHADLFALALGGYGLFGVILDVNLRVTNNARYRLEQFVVNTEDALAKFDAEVRDSPNVEMVYARLNLTPRNFMKQVILNVLLREESGEIPTLSEPGLADIRRLVFRGAAMDGFGQSFRWNAETKLQPLLSGKIFSRNQLLNESVDVFQNLSAMSTDILHEYFIPRHRASEFIRTARTMIPAHHANVLNVTVRAVNEDKDTVLRYADRDMIAFVMLFVQERTSEAESGMAALTRDLIDASILHEGRYYLPYRPHATREQFFRAYPMASEFFRRKREFDPSELFQNAFYMRYGRADDSAGNAN